ncbi:hypothetical protein, partial [uncultured Duncaniella sp.]|uniref:hypothetical protein n=1 Tax=uncultured Duncaniella sp. TaxID=2768039 RepID=UPI0026209F8E
RAQGSTPQLRRPHHQYNVQAAYRQLIPLSIPCGTASQRHLKKILYWRAVSLGPDCRLALSGLSEAALRSF